MDFRISNDSRRVRLGKDGSGYCWMCTECFWKRPSPPYETDKSLKESMAEFKQHACSEYPAHSVLVTIEQ